MRTPTTYRVSTDDPVNRSPRRLSRAQLPAPPTAGVNERMNRAIRLRRVLIATLILTATLTIFPVATASAATTDEAYTYTPNKICPIEWRKSTWHVKKLIRCTASYYGVGVEKALYVANRESNFQPSAYNAGSCAKGLFQHLCRYWPDRAYAYGFKGWSAYNARANAIVTMKMVRRYGWEPWGL